MEEQILWAEIKRGDKYALEQLHNRYYHQMYLYAAKSLPNSNGLAEELVSDCFIKLWENRKHLEIHTSLKQYLFVILHNSIIDQFRKKTLLTDSLAENIPAPLNEKEFDEQKQYAKLYLAVKRLPAQCRIVLELAVFESLSYNEIAEKLHISRNTVKTQIGRAYHALKDMLDPRDFSFFLVFRKSKNSGTREGEGISR